MSIDGIFLSIGEFGRQQYIYGFLLCVLNSGYAAFHMLQYPFVSFSVDFTCSTRVSLQSNVTNQCPDNEASQCDDLYFTTQTRSSIVSEWGLVCDQASSTKMTMSSFMTGVMIGAFVLGKFADDYGRKSCMMMTTAGTIVFNTLSGFVTSYNQYLLSKFCVGFFQAGFLIASFVLINELVGSSKRGLIGVSIQSFFALFIAIMSFLAYEIQHWRQLTMAISALGAPLLAINLLLPESPRWLLSKGRSKDAIKVLEVIAVGNGKVLSDRLKNTISNEDDGQSDQSRVHEKLSKLFGEKKLVLVTMIQIYSWFVNHVAYYGLTLAASVDGSADLYTATALSGVVEIPASIITYWLLGVTGRRATLSIAMVTGGLACLGIQLLASFAPAVIQPLALLGKLCLSSSNAVVYIHSGEIFPTTMRNSGMGLVSAAGRIGNIMAPYVVSLGDFIPFLQFTVIGVMSLVAGVLNMKLPETAGRELPDNIEDLRTMLNQHNNRRTSSSSRRSRTNDEESSGLLADINI